MTHELKIQKEYFSAVNEGKKRFEIRYDDRNYKVGDAIILNEIDNDNSFTGRNFFGIITYITTYEQKKGYVVFSFDPL
jgi:ASC-1-like (ASCH) protein